MKVRHSAVLSIVLLFFTKSVQLYVFSVMNDLLLKQNEFIRISRWIKPLNSFCNFRCCWLKHLKHRRLCPFICAQTANRNHGKRMSIKRVYWDLRWYNVPTPSRGCGSGGGGWWRLERPCIRSFQEGFHGHLDGLRLLGRHNFYICGWTFSSFNQARSTAEGIHRGRNPVR